MDINAIPHLYNKSQASLRCVCLGGGWVSSEFTEQTLDSTKSFMTTNEDTIIETTQSKTLT